MNTAVNAEGGYLVDPQTAERISRSCVRRRASRAIANVVTVEATSFDVLVDAPMSARAGRPRPPATETDTPQIERISIPLHELSALPKASQRLLDDAAFDIEGWLAGRIADKFARAEADAFINGDGVDKPKGFLTTGGRRQLGPGAARLCRHRHGGDFDPHQPGRRDRRSGLCAGRALPRQRELRDELEDRRRGAQDEGRRRPVPVVRRAGRRASPRG
jgi:hypothetical protein